MLVVGLKDRFYPLPTLQHVVAPAARAGFEVDYFVLLAMKPSEAFSAFRAFWLKPVPNPELQNVSAEALEAYVLRTARDFGARRAGVYLMHENIEVDQLPEHIFWRKRYFGQWYGLQTLDADQEAFAAAGTFWLALLRWRKVEMLWNWTVGSRPVADPTRQYTQIVLTRSDAYWIDDLRLERFPDDWKVYSRSYQPLCMGDGGTRMVSDQSLVLGGRVASHILTPYSQFFHSRHPELDTATCPEDFYWALARARGVKWEIVPQDWFPFFLAQHQTPRSGGDPYLCFRGSLRHEDLPTAPGCVEPSLVRHPFCEVQQ